MRPPISDAPRREGLKLTDNEVELLKLLGPLAAKSPRAVKRMVNIYRLMRVRYAGAALDAFLAAGSMGTPSYCELLFALACEDGLTPTTRKATRDWLSGHRGMAGDWNPTLIKDKLAPGEFDTLSTIAPAVGALTCAGMFTAFDEVRRNSFLP